MNVMNPKLHIVLTAKAKHAEFKCPLCKKLFISEYHLSRHKSRRHSHHCENVIKGHEQLVQYRNALDERIRNRQAVNASHRMEKLLRTLNLEETHLFDKTKRLNSTDISYGADHFPCVSVLTPITSNTNILENTAIKKIKITGSSSNIKYKENNDSKFKSHAYTWVTSRDLGSGDNKEIRFANERASQTEVTSIENEMLNGFENYDLKLVSNSIVKGTQTDEADLPFISRLENFLTSNADSFNQQTSVFEFVANNYVQSKSVKTSVNISTQTDEIMYTKICTYAQTDRLFDIYDEHSIPDIKNISEPIIGLRENAINFNESQEIGKNNIDNNGPVFDHSVVIACSNNFSVANGNEIDSIINKDYLTFEKEFQESFEARKNLLEEDDLMFCNDNLNDTSAVNIDCKHKPEIVIEQVSAASNPHLNGKSEGDVQDSFEAKKKLSSDDNLVVLKSSPVENVSDVKCLSESIEKSDNLLTQISVSSNSANNESNRTYVIYSDKKNDQEDVCRASNKRYEDIVQSIKDELSSRLRSLGVDPEWSGICDVVAKKTNAILTVRRINLSKKLPRFVPLRAMLNNTIDQILEAKECG